MVFTKGGRTRLTIAALGVLAAGLAVSSARGAPVRAFKTPPGPLTGVLLDFAVQADISIGTDEATHCPRPSPGVEGRFTVIQALDHILAGTGCGYRILDASTVQIVRARPAEPPRAPRSPANAAPSPPKPPTPAQTIPTRSVLPEVVVTATRRSALAIRLPDSIGVISGARMATDRDTSLGDLAGQAAGLTVTNLGPGSDKTIIRGLSDGGLTGHTQSTVGIYLDDTRLTYNAPDPDLRLADVDQVEVLQGPQGALYGSGSIAGVIHIVTRAPDMDRYGGSLLLSGAGTEGGTASGVVEAVANLPLIPGKLAVRAVGYGEHDGGYIGNVILGNSATNTTDRLGGRLAVRLNLNGDWSLEAGLTHQTLDSADSQYATPRLGPYQRNVHLQEPHGNDFDALHLTVQGALPAGEFKNTLSLVRHQLDERYDASGALLNFIARPSLPLGPPVPSAYDERDRIASVVDEATLTSIGASRFQWLLGGFVSSGRQTVDSIITTAPPIAGVAYAETRTDQIQELAAYGEATYDLTSSLAVGAGARVGFTQVSTTSLVSAPFSDQTAPFRGRLSNLDWAPKVSLRYQISPTAMAYVLISEGSRGDGFNTSGPIGTVFSGPGGMAEPFRRFHGDELWNFEAGAKLRTLSGHLTLRATGFYAIWTNIQSDQLLPSGLPYTANIGDGRNFGLELEAAYAIDGLELRLNSLLDQPELTRNRTPFPSLLHSGLPGVPRGTVGAAIHYERRSGQYRPFIDLAANYVGLSRLTFDARTTRRMGDYTMTKLTAGVDTGAWRMTAFIDNPLGVTGNTFAYGNPFTLRRTRQITPLEPRTSGLSLSRTF